MIEIILGIAQSVLANVISDFVSGRRQTARREEIVEIVRQVVINRSETELREEEFRRIVASVVREVGKIADTDPDLEIRGNVIRDSSGAGERSADVKSSDGELELRLLRLDEAVASRRKQLEVKKKQGNGNLEFTKAPDASFDLLSALSEMEDNIQKRRSG
ncbi:hypothetical protein [Streptomyces sp. bgisy084]|uniref:hypothetical protein n=1 Tax=Streptomyces sp. bgisy084 TaxID=3413777 RepID=UPI003D72F014